MTELGEDESVPGWVRSETGLAWFIDTNFIAPRGEEPEAVAVLLGYHEEGWINLFRSDVLDTELIGAAEPQRSRLLDASGRFVEYFGPAVVGHSRAGHGVGGSEQDAVLLDQVLALLRPGLDRRTAREQHDRDAMQVAWAVRYGANGFITGDKKILNRDSEFRAAFDGFRLLSPEQALAIAERFIRRSRACSGRSSD